MTRKSKRSLAQYLAEHFFDSIEKANLAVKLNVVKVNGKVVKRSGINIDEEKDTVEVIGRGSLFASRGGYKLQEALISFGLNVSERVCLDIGASTGGFTDCLLQYGASEVYAIDTGYGQLAWNIRTNPNVHPIERMNVRYLLPERLYANPAASSKATFAAVDVSFISVLKIIPSLQRLLAGPDISDLIILIKPQFEASKDSVGRSGVVRNPSIHLGILKDFVAGCYRGGLDIRKVQHSPLLGPAGNIEFIAHATWPRAGPIVNPALEDWLDKIVKRGYSELGLQ